MATAQQRIDAGVAAILPHLDDRVTFSRPTVTIDTSGGHGRSFTNTSPASVPCSYRPAKATESEKLLAEKSIKGSVYAITVPAKFGSDMVDVDATCTATIAARDGFAAKTFKVEAIQRAPGAIKVLASSAE